MQVCNAPETCIGYETVSEIIDYEERNSVVGYYPNVPNYIMGHPLNMVDVKPVRDQHLKKKVHFWCNLAIDSMYDSFIYRKRGVAVFNLIRYYSEQEEAGISLTLFDATFIEGETFIQSVEIDEDTFKDNIQYIYNILTDISAYRVLFLNSKMVYIKENGLSASWSEGYGYCMRSEDVGRALGIDRNDIYIGVPVDEFHTDCIDLNVPEVDCDQLGSLSSEV